MVELVDTLVSGTSASRHACSSQVPGRFKTPYGVFFYVCMFVFINRVSSGRGYNHTRENISFLPVTGLGNSIFTALKSKLSSGVQSGL